MRINNILLVTIITLLLLSIIPYTLSACTKVPVADEATKKKAEEEKKKADEELKKAKKKHKELNEINNMHWMIAFLTAGEKTGTLEGPAETVLDAAAASDRRDGIRAAKKKLEEAEKTAKEATEKWKAVQDEEVHPIYVPACGHKSHGVIMCDPDELAKTTDYYWQMWHEFRQASCADYIYVGSQKHYCIVTGFFLCTPHEHVYKAPENY